MPAITLYFQVHQPYRLRPYTVFDLGVNHLYEDPANADTMRTLADTTYLPMNALLLELLQEHGDRFAVNFSISGIALDLFEQFTPEVIASFQKLAATGRVAFITEPYAHSLAFLFSRAEFTHQVMRHRERIKALFGVEPAVFRNAELIYNNELAAEVEAMGYEVILAEGADHVLGWRSPNYVYQPAQCRKTRLLLRNHHLSNDIAFRFSDQSWDGFPLTAETFAQWVHAVDTFGDVINLFMDYETFGEHHDKDTGIFAFMRALPGAVLANPDFVFSTIAEAARAHQSMGVIDVPQYTSWTDAERDLTAWLGNDMQLDAIEALYKLEDRVTAAHSPDLRKVWERLQTSDHFYYMSTKWFSDGDMRKHFNPYASPYDAYINFMNVMADLELSLDETLALAPRDDEKPAATPQQTSPAGREGTAAAKPKTKDSAKPAKTAASAVRAPRRGKTGSSGAASPA